MGLPSGTVTFLFTDIEGSSRLWEDHPGAMRLALDRHNAIVRQAIESAGGAIFKTVGDAFCAAFEKSDDAATSAVQAQIALQAEPWPPTAPIRARIAIHTGSAEPHAASGDYFGPALNRIARILAIGHGGQILLSAATHELCQDLLPSDCSVKALGEQRLKDLGRPEDVFQLCHSSLPSNFPPLRSLDNPLLKHNLPIQLTSFVGREKELDEVKSRLAVSRLLTLTGSGGCGKTRLALQTAAELVDTFADGAWFVELAPLSDPLLLAQTVSGVMRIKQMPGVVDTLQTLADYLGPKRLLLLLDNCEHLIDACADLADSLLKSCPGICILATSRESLRTAGEVTYRVPSLSMPLDASQITVQSLGQYDAVRLFGERAGSVHAGFEVTDRNAASLVGICRKLDGIPLAIELAAARVRSMPLELIEQRLDKRLALLNAGARTGTSRHWTLRSLIDWSYDLLSDSERALLCRLSVFAGGWSLEAAEEVCSDEPEAVLDLLTGLVEKSLVVYQDEPPGRYRMLETVREYASERLQQRGEWEAIRNSHHAYYLRLASQFDAGYRSSESASWVGRFIAEEDNLRSAMDWSASLPDGVDAEAVFCDGLRWLWIARGQFPEAWSRCRAALDRTEPGEVTKRRADLLRAIACTTAQAGRYEETREFLEEEIVLRRRLGDRHGEAGAMTNCGYVAMCAGDYAAGMQLYSEARDLFAELGDERAELVAMLGIGNVAGSAGDLEKACSTLDEVAARSRKADLPFVLQWAHSNLCLSRLIRGDYREALAAGQDALRVSSGLSDRFAQTMALGNCGACLHRLGKPVTACRVLGAVFAEAARTGCSFTPSDAAEINRSITELKTELSATEFEAEWAAGNDLSLQDAVMLVLAEA